MTSSLQERFKADLDRVSDAGLDLANGFRRYVSSDEIDAHLEQRIAEAEGDEKEKKRLEKLARKIKLISENITHYYEKWYSEAGALIEQLIPDRIEDFRDLYKKPRAQRKDITFENYRIQDALQGLRVSRAGESLASPRSALSKVEQQVAILNSAKQRFESSLFDIKTLVRADVLDSELEAARELAKNGFLRAAGAVSGVVLEKHLGSVADNRSIKTRKKHPSISDWNDLLKTEGVIDVVIWRKIQHMGDVRNLCDHNKQREPTKQEVEDLISGVEGITKTLI